MPRVIHFEIPCDNPERAAEFYKKVFDWEIKKWEGPVEYWMVMTGEKGTPGIDGGMMKRAGEKKEGAANAYVCTIDVPSIDEYIKKVSSNGGIVTTDKMEVPTVGTMAYCQDTEGNLFGIMEFAPGAMM